MFQNSHISLIVANHNKLMKEGLIVLLNKQTNIIVIDEAETGQELIYKCQKKNPDLLLIDSHIKDPDACLTSKKIKEICFSTRIIILTDQNEAVDKNLNKNRIINGFLSKNISPEELIVSIQKVILGEFILYPTDNYCIEEVEENIPKNGDLTQRENEILFYLSQGLSTKDIADKLCLSIRTIDSHRSKIIQKYNLRNSTELLHFAHEICKKPY